MQPKLTLISHFYNEEYLLPWWLNHHKKIFDDAVLINYGSTDNSVNIIKEICPDWRVVDSRNNHFDAELCDAEVLDYEREIKGFTFALNITEFFLPPHNYRDYLHDEERETCYHMQIYTIVDENTYVDPTYSESLIKQKHFGHEGEKNGCHGVRSYRYLSNYKRKVLSVGRHSGPGESKKLDNFYVFWYAFCPWNEKTIQRKLQIKNKVSQNDMQKGFGGQHFWPRERMEEYYNGSLKVGRSLDSCLLGSIY